MKEMSDEELQEMIDRNLSVSDTGLSATGKKDAEAYALLFEELAKEPGIPLRYNFPEKVTAKILAGKNRLNDIKLYVLITSACIVVLVAACLYLSTFNTSPAPQLLANISRYKWVVVFGTVVFIIVQYLDRKIVRRDIHL